MMPLMSDVARARDVVQVITSGYRSGEFCLVQQVMEDGTATLAHSSNDVFTMSVHCLRVVYRP